MASSNSPQPEIKLELPDLIRVYQNGSYERLSGRVRMSAGLDVATGVTSKDVLIPSSIHPVSARLYLPDTNTNTNNKLPVLVYYHGGGFIIESTASLRYHSHMNDLAAKAGLLIVSIEYRRVPEHPLPAAFDDSLVGLQWVASGVDPWVAERGDLGRLFVGGDSAGATIAHEMIVRCQREGVGLEFEGLLLMHPYFWGSTPVGSESTDPEVRSYYENIWLYSFQGSETGTTGLDDLRLNPLAAGAEALAEAIKGCRRVLVCVGELDPLAERGIAYAEALEGSPWGGEVELVVSDGEDHVFHLINPESESATTLIGELVAFFSKHPKSAA